MITTYQVRRWWEELDALHPIGDVDDNMAVAVIIAEMHAAILDAEREELRRAERPACP